MTSNEELLRLADCCNRQNVHDVDDTIKLLQACASVMREAAARLEALGEGVVVPLVPTEEMTMAGAVRFVQTEHSSPHSASIATEVYRAMIAARPK